MKYDHPSKTFGWLFIGVLFLAGLIFYGCGQQGGGSSTNYTISGKYVLKTSSSSVKASTALPVTHIIAIGANNETYLADLSSDGTFSLRVDKGWPYAVGFYNKDAAAGKITLLGYLKQSDVDWHSLPLMDPSGNSTDLGTVEVDAGSSEATASIDLTSLISQMNMSSATAHYYGELDGPMAVFTNVDVDGNGVFDFQESKGYQLQQFVSLNDGISTKLSDMLENYHEYPLDVNYYSFETLVKDGANPAQGTGGTYTFPSSVTSQAGTSAVCSGEVIHGTESTGWSFGLISGEITAPALPPAGTYTIEVVGKTRLTFNNFQGCATAALGNTEGVIYPVFSISVEASTGYVKGLNYKWRIISSGTARDATAAELKAAVLDTSLNSTFIDPSPVITFYPMMSVPQHFDRDGSYIDLSSLAIKYSSVTSFICHFNLTSRVRCMVNSQL
ncbi:MAG: hypothetical protein PHG97_03990 [Candidatus Margulisbacteria bacterium]|nr:hypothetical protein [Candidatus Margulisiibacteriota bacterium]